MSHLTICTFCSASAPRPDILWEPRDEKVVEPVHKECLEYIASGILHDLNTRLTDKAMFTILNARFKEHKFTWDEFTGEVGELGVLAHEILCNVVKSVERTCDTTLSLHYRDKGKESLRAIFDTEGKRVFQERLDFRLSFSAFMMLHKRRINALFGPGLLDYCLTDRFDPHKKDDGSFDDMP